MPNGPNCMSLLYRHLVIPDLAPPTCESNKFLFCGGTVTSSSASTPNRHEKRSHPNFASSSIIARSVANCRLPRAKISTEISPCAAFVELFGARPPSFGPVREALTLMAEICPLDGPQSHPIRTLISFKAQNFHRQNARR